MHCWPSQGVDVGMGKLEAAIYAQTWGISLLLMWCYQRLALQRSCLKY